MGHLASTPKNNLPGGARLECEAMSTGGTSAEELARVNLACGRIGGAARAIAEAYRFGVPEGPHPEPWTAEYHREAVHVYARSLPASYQLDIASLFNHSADTMDVLLIPGALAEHWHIVTRYQREASRSIYRWLASERLESSNLVPSPDLDIRTLPTVIHFDELAALSTVSGARRLEEAARAAQCHVGAISPTDLDNHQQVLLRMVASGTSIVDMASQLGYSERSMYRVLADLWRVLGVKGRAEGIRKATSEGLIG